MSLPDPSPAPTITCCEADLAQSAAARDANALREILKLNNRRLYRIERAILRDAARPKMPSKTPIFELKALLETGLKIFQGHEKHAEHVTAELK